MSDDSRSDRAASDAELERLHRALENERAARVEAERIGEETIRRMALANRELEAKNEELRNAREVADEALRAKRQFLANMSHEIRTPLNGVIGMLSLVSRTDLTERQERFVQAARSSAESLHGLLDDILNYSRMEVGKLELRTRPFDLRALVEDVTDLAATRADSKGLQVACLLRQRLPHRLVGDPERLRQVLTNLMNNAVKFTDRGEVTCRVRVVEEDAERVMLAFEVRDTGIGISEQALAKLFQPFSQVDDSHARRFGGAGLGLAICRQLVSLLGGEMEVSSTPGRGSSFGFTAPFALDVSASSDDDDALNVRRVLVVDENATNRQILEGLCEGWGIQCLSVADGDDALETLVRAAAVDEPFDVVLVDGQSEAMDAWAFSDAVRAESTLSSVLLVLIASIGDCLDDEAAQAAGFDACLAKPIRERSLRDTLVRLTRHRLTPVDASSYRPAGDSQRPAGRRRILLAEDNEINQMVAVEMLAELGCDVDVASDGEQAVEAVTSHDYDLILMDCQMPGMDGMQAAAAIRNWRGAAAPPIVALTAHALAGDRERILAGGMDDYLTKPVTHEALKRTLARWANRASPPRATPLPPRSTPLPPRFVQEAPAPKPMKPMDIFRERTPPEVDALRGFVAEARTAELRALAHRMKGSCVVLGLTKMAEVCSLLEKLDGDAVGSQGPALVGRLADELANVLATERGV
ncbi:MAG: response regulator [Polyangiaceae bacterium]|nr:response regulator [Polyangiaceae bacterium]